LNTNLSTLKPPKSWPSAMSDLPRSTSVVICKVRLLKPPSSTSFLAPTPYVMWSHKTNLAISVCLHSPPSVERLLPRSERHRFPGGREGS
jgi:hypothetical protein